MRTMYCVQLVNDERNELFSHPEDASLSGRIRAKSLAGLLLSRQVLHQGVFSFEGEVIPPINRQVSSLSMSFE